MTFKEKRFNNKTLDFSIERELHKAPKCPICFSPLEEEWDEEIDDYGEFTGHEFEIYLCYECGYKEFI